jgi:hypothetical protein
MNSDLYDAYSSPGPRSSALILNCTVDGTTYLPATPHRIICSALPHDARTGVLLRDTCPGGWAPPSPTAAPSAPPLTRQPSIRRLPARSRTVDFTDCTSRRRSSGREGNYAGPRPRTRGGRLSRPSNDVITPLPEHNQRALPSVLPVPAPRAAVEPRAKGGRPPQADAQLQRTFLLWLPSNILLSLPPPADLCSPRVAPPHGTRLRTTSPVPMGVRIAIVCTHRRTEREWERNETAMGGGSRMRRISAR